MPFLADDVHKLRDVLRLTDGDLVVVIDSAAQAFTAAVELSASGAVARLETALATSGIESEREIVLAQAIPKGQKMDFVVEKATELGIARLLPVRTARTIGDATPNKIERWGRLARAAAQQSGRTRMPAIEPACDFAELCRRIAAVDAAVFAWELARTPLRTALAGMREARRIMVVIGPEGGFAHDEAQAAQQAGAVAVTLGRRILRTETAALVVLAAMLYDAGEL